MDCLREKKKTVQSTEEMLNDEDDDYFILYLTHSETTSFWSNKLNFTF
jgi:hypothetical protein